jgi:hypothetical protein
MLTGAIVAAQAYPSIIFFLADVASEDIGQLKIHAPG